RILLAERERLTAQAEDLRQRLPTYDEDGVMRQRLAARADLSIETVPAGAAVRLLRIDRHGGRARELPAESLGRSPLQVPLPPGSYVLVFALPGRPPVRYPVL